VSQQHSYRRSDPVQSSRRGGDADVYTWRPTGIDSIELYRGSDITVEYPRHWHDDLYLCATIDGASYLDCAGTSLSVPRGTLVILPSGEVHTNRKLGCTFRCLFIEVKGLQSTLEKFMERSISGIDFRTSLIDDSPTISSFLHLHRSLERRGTGLQRESSLLAFLHALVDRHSAASIPVSPDGNENVAVQRSKKFLDEHYADPVSLLDLARLTGLSPYHLNRSFSRKIGMPPHAYHLEVRIARAKSFLRLGLSSSETASLAGFVDQSHLTRHFKKSVGVTPGQYSKNVQDPNTRTR